ncbi:MAG: type II toxin-antitoxin system RelE/ParE family toxin [Burkholderiales bacterium]|nr:type II toxin-antitoxin system RelE/ParE family toxin [Burkholderiales bacterium]
MSAPPLPIRVSPRAAAQIEAAAAWWQEHRPFAPGAIHDDIARVLALLSAQPGVGTPARGVKVPGARRLILSRVRYYIYYRVSEGVLEILAFWHMSRSQEPRL